VVILNSEHRLQQGKEDRYAVGNLTPFPPFFFYFFDFFDLAVNFFFKCIFCPCWSVSSVVILNSAEAVFPEAEG
jgi:hypothetical protein